MDSSATDHLTSDLARLTTQERYGGTDQISIANGTGHLISHIGESRIAGSNTTLTLKNVLHVPSISKHLLSAHKLAADNNIFLEFHADYFLIKDKATRTILYRGKSYGGLYPIPHSSTFSKRQVLSSVRIPFHMWHQRLGHPHNSTVKTILRQHSLPHSACTPSVCDVCQRAKSHQLPYRHSHRRSSFPLELVHTDVWGPTIPSSKGFRYYVSFIDDFSRFCWVYLLKFKSDVETVFYNFQNHVERLLNRKILVIQSDGGGE